jgi:1,2-diacylglycerol 3-alpha-glucosyltransferase
MKVAILFPSLGPYHAARIQALHQLLSQHQIELIAYRFAKESRTYPWKPTEDKTFTLTTLTSNTDAERCSILSLFQAWLFHLQDKKIRVALLPSYYPIRNLLCLLICKMLRVRCVIMSESWEGTGSSNFLKKYLKRQLAKCFESAVVGGTPHAKFFHSLGMKKGAVFMGYDAVDNEYFIRQSDEARQRAAPAKARLDLPDFYFLSLGRLVQKKNLEMLILAYHLLTQSHKSHSLVIVGSGELDSKLRALCNQLDLLVIDHTTSPVRNPSGSQGVHFYGFRQLQENPSFYAFASAFILPSTQEEWGLVVNEAMACGIPVLVSKKAGCAEDLVYHGENGFQFNPTSPRELAYYLKLLVKDPVLRERMGRRSREIIQNWSCHRFANSARSAIERAIT